MIDVIIVSIVVLVLGLIVYFRFIKKDSKGVSCNCYKAKTCGLKVAELKDLFFEQEKQV